LAGLGRKRAWLLGLLLLLPAALSSDALFSGARAASPPAPATTEAFLRAAVGAVKFGAASSQLALKKTKNDHVLGYAHQLASDYTVAGMKLRQAVADAKLPALRDVYDDAHKAVFDQLSHTPPGKPFAKAYLDAQAKVLPGNLELFRVYAEKGDNERLRLFAQDMVPLVRGHLEQLDKLDKFRK
jgi:predicted outer membrane protein